MPSSAAKTSDPAAKATNKPARKSAVKRDAPQALVAELAFRREHRCFKRGRKLRLQPQVNLLVGDQGAGKSTVLELLADLGSARDRDRVRETIDVTITAACKLVSFDFERSNPRTQSHFMDHSFAGM